jgi:hypothetical protein
MIVTPASAAGTHTAAWTLTAQSLPTNFTANSSSSIAGFPPEYDFNITNTGGAASTGDVTFTATLPVGVTPTDAKVETDLYYSSGTCEIAGQTVTCTTSTDIQPGQWALVEISVSVAADAPANVTAHGTVSGGGGETVSRDVTSAVSSTLAPFGFLPGDNGLNAAFTASDGSPVTQAGSHPNQLTLDFGFPSKQIHLSSSGVENPRDIGVKLPEGVVADPSATPLLCTEAQLETLTALHSLCPDSSQVGTITIVTFLSGATPSRTPLYNMVPTPGTAANLGFNIIGLDSAFAHITGGVDTGGNYALTAETSDLLARGLNPVMDVQAQLWGDPSSPIHDTARGACGATSTPTDTCPVAPTNHPFLTMPSACSGPLVTSARADTWENPGVFRSASTATHDRNGNPVGVTGCSRLDFNPSITIRPTTTAADSPTGLDVDLRVPQNSGVDNQAEATLKKAVVDLPEGMTVNPSLASGLDACTPAEIGLGTAAADSCPDAAKVGSVEITTPLLDHPLKGGVFLATQNDNPFNSLLAGYIAVKDPVSGVVIKLPGKIEPDAVTGRLRSVFDNNPQLPFSDLKVNFFGGTRAPLVSPPTCGHYTTTSALSPWSAADPNNPTASETKTSTDSFDITSGPGGGPCPHPGQFVPGFEAGTVTPIAGSYSPLIVKASRPDGSQALEGLSLDLPPGLVGKLAGTPSCPQAALDAAATRSGKAELASPSCPAASKVGVVNVGAGAGSTPFYVAGSAYLAGPYKGAPLSIAVITPAVAGPFDLGTVVVRAAAQVDPTTAQIHVTSDPLPSILQGIPLHVRSVAVNTNKPGFTLNPTSCEPMSFNGTLIGTSAAKAVSNRFQVGGCRGLDFSPKLNLQLKGPTRRGGNPALTAVLTQPLGQANIASLSVALPHSEFLAQSHIRTICTRVQFAAGSGGGEQCPSASVYGHVRAESPLVDYPLEGPVFLRSSSHNLPDLVAVVKGPASQPIVVAQAGRIDSIKGGIRNSFEAFPDVPISKVVLKMPGGRKGLLENSTNICRGQHRATVRLGAQSGERYELRPELKASCGKKKAKKSQGRHSRRARRG